MGTETLSSATHKCVLVIDHGQPTEIVANIASVLSMTLGCEVGNIVSHDEYEQALSEAEEDELHYIGIGVCAEKKVVNKATGNLSLLK